MAEKDLILDDGHQLQFEEILTYINEPALSWWKTVNSYIQEKFNAKPKLTYSSCSMQKGWNVKYNKSGKSICTLYPAKETFIVLIVVKLELAHIILAMNSKFEQALLDIVDSARPFNGTKWLMIPVENEAILNNVQELLYLKYSMSATRKLRK